MLKSMVLASALLLSGQAFAADPPAPPPPQPKPCERGTSQMVIAGQDQDEQRCVDAIVQGLIEKMSAEAGDQRMVEARITAKLALALSDAKAAKDQLKAQADHIKDLEDKLAWYKSYMEGIKN